MLRYDTGVMYDDVGILGTFPSVCDGEWILPALSVTPAKWHIWLTLQAWSTTICCRCSGNISSGSRWRADTTGCSSCSGETSTTCCATSTSSTIISPPYSRACVPRPSGVVRQKTEVSYYITTAREKGKVSILLNIKLTQIKSTFVESPSHQLVSFAKKNVNK